MIQGIRGVLFDKDGTIIDFNETWMPAYREIALSLADGDQRLAEQLLVSGGYDPASGKVAAGSMLAAAHTSEIARLWLEQLPGYELEGLIDDLERRFVESSEHRAVPVAGLDDLLKELKSRGFVLGVATNDSEEGAVAGLRLCGVLGRFDYVAGWNSGYGAKPGPGMVLGFCELTGIEPGQVAVVGDNLHDLEMGHAAGSGLVIGVLTGTSRREDLAARAHHVLQSVVELEDLLAR